MEAKTDLTKDKKIRSFSSPSNYVNNGERQKKSLNLKERESH